MANSAYLLRNQRDASADQWGLLQSYILNLEAASPVLLDIFNFNNSTLKNVAISEKVYTAFPTVLSFFIYCLKTQQFSGRCANVYLC